MEDLEDRIVEAAKRSVDKAEAFLGMIEGRGWKLLMDEFFKRELDRERFLETTNPEEAYWVKVRMKAYIDLLKFIESQVGEGRRGARLLSQLGIGGNENG